VVGTRRTLGQESARLRFGEEAKAEGIWTGRRLLFLDEKPAFELMLLVWHVPVPLQATRRRQPDGVRRGG